MGFGSIETATRNKKTWYVHKKKCLIEIAANLLVLDKYRKTVSFQEDEEKLTLGQSTNVEVTVDWLTWFRYVFMISLFVVLYKLCILHVSCCDLRAKSAVTLFVTNALQVWTLKRASPHEKLWFCRILHVRLYFLYFWPFYEGMDLFLSMCKALNLN